MVGVTLGFSFLRWSNSSISYCWGILLAYFLRRSVDESESDESDSLDEEEEGAHRFRDTFFFFLSLVQLLAMVHVQVLHWVISQTGPEVLDQDIQEIQVRMQ